MAQYISREAVVRYLKGYSEKECNSSSIYGMITSFVLNKAERALSEMPAADVQPVKHGRWIEVSPKHSRCSVCDTTCLITVYPISKGANYCPNCGARMEQEG